MDLAYKVIKAGSAKSPIIIEVLVHGYSISNMIHRPNSKNTQMSQFGYLRLIPHLWQHSLAWGFPSHVEWNWRALEGVYLRFLSQYCIEHSPFTVVRWSFPRSWSKKVSVQYPYSISSVLIKITKQHIMLFRPPKHVFKVAQDRSATHQPRFHGDHGMAGALLSRQQLRPGADAVSSAAPRDPGDPGVGDWENHQFNGKSCHKSPQNPVWKPRNHMEFSYVRNDRRVNTWYIHELNH